MVFGPAPCIPVLAMTKAQRNESTRPHLVWTLDVILFACVEFLGYQAKYCHGSHEKNSVVELETVRERSAMPKRETNGLS